MNRRLRAFQRLESARNQFRTALDQNLQIHVVRNIALFNGPAAEVEIRLRSGRETDLDFRETHIDQQAEHALLAVMPHGVDQSLVAVAQIDRTPDRRLFDAFGRPSAVIELRRRERRVFGTGNRHALLRADTAWDTDFGVETGWFISRFLPAFNGVPYRQARTNADRLYGFSGKEHRSGETEDRPPDAPLNEPGDRR